MAHKPSLCSCAFPAPKNAIRCSNITSAKWVQVLSFSCIFFSYPRAGDNNAAATAAAAATRLGSIQERTHAAAFLSHRRCRYQISRRLDAFALSEVYLRLEVEMLDDEQSRSIHGCAAERSTSTQSGAPVFVHININAERL